MDYDFDEEQQVPSAFLTSISFNFSTQKDIEKVSVIAIDAASEVTDPKLGVPNPSHQCSTCGAGELKYCEGHFGVIKFPFTILHPYFVSEVAKILNKICPGCKSIRQELRIKGGDSVSSHNQPKGCKYCVGNSVEWYPRVKFRVSSTELFRNSSIIVEVNERLPKKFQHKRFRGLPADFWDFIPKDEQQEESCSKLNRRVLSHAQVRYLLNAIDPKFIKKFVLRADSLFLNSFPVTPNCHRVTEITHAFSNGQRLIFDERTRAYKKLVDFRGIANELGSRVLECLKNSKASCTALTSFGLSTDNSSTKDLAYVQLKKGADPSTSSGLRWVKDVVLGKRSDHCFRMVVVGDPRIKLSEIGIPRHIAERLQISETLNRMNFDRLSECFIPCFFQKGEVYVRRKHRLVRVKRMAELQFGDTIYRQLNDGDIVLINRPPSIHQHSLIALSVKLLPVTSVLSINPLCCSPLRGDFDGDCLHGYIPQSIDARVELSELVALDKQLINGQNGRNLLSLSQDSLTAAHLVMEDGVLLNLFQMQQLQMFCPNQILSPAIVKSSSLSSFFWTGKQLFSLLLPSGFNYVFPSSSVYVNNGELLSSEGSFWLRDHNSNLFQSLIKHCQGKVLDILYAAQELLCEWLSMRGLSVSLSDLYLSPDSYSRKNMMDEIFCGLQEAEQTCSFKQLMVDSCRDFLVEDGQENAVVLDVERLCYEKQKSAALGQASVDAFKQVFRDIQNLAYKYASNDNSLLAMFKAGSKGNLMKLVQHSMCLGLQHSLVPLSFQIPHQLSCAAWNNQKALGSARKADDIPEWAQSYIPYAVVENCFLTGLNPLECFVHSVTSRDSSFSDNADLPGTLNRRLMFLMRDLYAAYDGTVRNAYGNQLIQFSYNPKDSSTPNSSTQELYGESVDAHNVISGQPVGSLSASAISEAAYSALDQPISLLETSPLLNLKKVLECGSISRNADRTMTIFLSEKLGRRRHGFEYGALEVKNHLERLVLSDIVSTVMIIFSPQTCGKMHFSPWVCHFHICKVVQFGNSYIFCVYASPAPGMNVLSFQETAKRRGLKLHSIINSLQKRCDSFRAGSKFNLPNLQIKSKDCSVVQKEDGGTFCLSVAIADISKNASLPLKTVQDFIIPYLLGSIIKGYPEIKKVHILWNDHQKVSRCDHGSSGELYLRIAMSGGSYTTNLWSLLKNDCLQIMEMIDWSRSHPDNIHDFCLAYGIDAGKKYFLNRLRSAISDTGKSTLPQHLLLVADSLSATGEFVSLNAKGIARQREHSSVSSPFMQACFSNPGACFIKAAKAGVVDDLKGNLDALAWGKVPSTGTAGHFDIIYSAKGHELAKPIDVYNLLGSQIILDDQSVKIETPAAPKSMSDKCGSQIVYKYASKKGESETKQVLRSLFTTNDILRLSHLLKSILHNHTFYSKLVPYSSP
ncbi:DNA-directed RNA polymerase IV subunit 1 [Morella rubra]|uniref:DNA-directed RNA polymerase n=1 Tax=Morella rubra TaxID=262757 RepID=A0A6A1VW64_9ROSI|nr:DNA-directed RNA polymerase IV subunit 1 [Morella rubra]